MSDRVVVASTSLAEDAAYLTMQDAGAAANRTGVEYRIIGGQMVTVHVANSGADAPLRMTTDTDLGLAARVLDKAACSISSATTVTISSQATDCNGTAARGRSTCSSPPTPPASGTTGKSGSCLSTRF